LNKHVARNVLVVLGVWVLSGVIGLGVHALVIAVKNGLTFKGDVGTVTMWLWEGLPDDLVAALGAVILVWVIETRKPLGWVGFLALLYLYGGVMNAWRDLNHGWQTSPRTPHYIGILTQASIPTLICLAIGVWWTRHRRAIL
jgi:hypothetical protein